MQNEPINTNPIQMFIQQVKNAEQSQSREVKLDIANAKRLAFTLGEVMARLHGDLEKFVKENANGNNDVIEVNIGEKSDW